MSILKKNNNKKHLLIISRAFYCYRPLDEDAVMVGPERVVCSVWKVHWLQDSHIYWGHVRLAKTNIILIDLKLLMEFLNDASGSVVIVDNIITLKEEIFPCLMHSVWLCLGVFKFSLWLNSAFTRLIFLKHFLIASVLFSPLLFSSKCTFLLQRAVFEVVILQGKITSMAHYCIQIK